MNSMSIAVLAAGASFPGDEQSTLLFAVVAAAVAGSGAALPWYLDALQHVQRLRSRRLMSGPAESERSSSDDRIASLHALRQADFEYVVASRRRRNLGAAIAGLAAGLVLLFGLVLVATGALAAGIAIALMSSVPAAVTALFFSRARESDEQVGAVRREIEKITLVDSMTRGAERDALIADLVRGSAMEKPTRRADLPYHPPRQVTGGQLSEREAESH